MRDPPQVVVVQRKVFLKRRRLELAPFVGVTVNDLFVRHYAFGAEANYFVAESVSLGLEAQGFRRQRNRRSRILQEIYDKTPSLSRHELAAAASASMGLGHGKLVTFNRWISYWELFARGGGGVIRVRPSIPGGNGPPRNAGMVHLGLGLRFFASSWLTINAGARDYVFRDAGSVYHQVMLHLGAGIYFPLRFSYRTGR